MSLKKGLLYRSIGLEIYRIIRYFFVSSREKRCYSSVDTVPIENECPFRTAAE